MNNQQALKPTLRFVIQKTPVSRRQLACVLAQLGMPRKHAISVFPRKKTEGNMWDLYEEAEALWKKKIKKHHPDRGGDWRYCAHLNSLWTRAKELFMRNYQVGYRS